MALIFVPRHRLIPALAAAAFFGLGACSPLAASAAAQDEPSSHAHQAIESNSIETVTLIGANGDQVVLERGDLAAMPREHVTFSRHEDTSVYEGPLLLDLLSRVGVPTSPLRKDQQAMAVLVTAADGYQVAFGLAETDLATRADRIILADTDDGEPLSPEAGPFMIVAENDARAARSPRMVTSIRVIPLGEPQD